LDETGAARVQPDAQQEGERDMDIEDTQGKPGQPEDEGLGGVSPLRVPPPVPSTQPAMAELPSGILARADYILRHPDEVLESIRHSKELGTLARTLVLVTALAAAAYGVVMGATNLLQGSGHSLGTELQFIVAAAAKVPVLFLMTLLIVLPPMYVSGVYAEVRLRAGQVATLLLFCTAIATITLASMATVAAFFSLTTRGYEFMKLLHVLFFAYAGATGIIFLRRAYARAGATTGVATDFIFVLWLGLYAFVGTQLAWVLRPFIGTPEMPFTLFREQRGNFYENVSNTLQNLL